MAASPKEEKDVLSLLMNLKYRSVSPDGQSQSLPPTDKNDTCQRSPPSLPSTVSHSFEQVATPPSCFPLTAPEDKQYLTHVECLVRSKCCEYAVCTSYEESEIRGDSTSSSFGSTSRRNVEARPNITTSSSTLMTSHDEPNRASPTSMLSSSSSFCQEAKKQGGHLGFLGQVGIRCRFCKHLPPSNRSPNSNLYPQTLHDIYTTVNTMIGSHFLSCPSVPAPLKKTLASAQTLMSRNFRTISGGVPDACSSGRMNHRNNDPIGLNGADGYVNGNGVKVSQQPYWVESAKALGLIDTEKGIRVTSVPVEYGGSSSSSGGSVIGVCESGASSISTGSTVPEYHPHSSFPAHPSSTPRPNSHRNMNMNRKMAMNLTQSSSASIPYYNRRPIAPTSNAKVITTHTPTPPYPQSHQLNHHQRKALPLHRPSNRLPSANGNSNKSKTFKTSSHHTNTATHCHPRTNLDSNQCHETTVEELVPFMGDASLVHLDDKDLVPDFLFLSMAQMKRCQLTTSDRVGCYKDRPVGFVGMCCKHCGGQPGFGKFFPATVRSLAQTTTSQTIVKHISTKCRFVPLDVRRKVIQLQEEQAQKDNLAKNAPKSQGDGNGNSSNSMDARPKYGSRKIFFERVWKRVHGTSTPTTGKGSKSTTKSKSKKRKSTEVSKAKTFSSNRTNSSGRLVSPHDTDASGDESLPISVSMSLSLEQRDETAHGKMSSSNEMCGRQGSSPPPGAMPIPQDSKRARILSFEGESHKNVASTTLLKSPRKHRGRIVSNCN